VKKKSLALLTVAATLSVASTSYAALAGANTVNSAAIIDGQVMTADLANAAVTAAKIATGTITATQLAAGAVTDAKITGPIATSKLSVGTAAGTVAAGNHNHDGLYQKKYGNVIVVAKSGGDFTDPLTAINSITDASATNPYLIKIMPGVYDIGFNKLMAYHFIDIEGSGEAVTKIIGSYSLVVQESGTSELRSLTVESVSTIGGAYALQTTYGSAARISHVTAICNNYCTAIENDYATANYTDVTAVARGTNAAHNGSNIGIQNISGSPSFTNIKVDVSSDQPCYGIVNNGSAATYQNVAVVTNGGASSYYDFGLINGGGGTSSFDNVTVTSLGGSGLLNGDGTTRISNSKISAPVGVDNAAGNTFIANTMITGGVSGTGSKCLSVYDSSLNPVACQ